MYSCIFNMYNMISFCSLLIFLTSSTDTYVISLDWFVKSNFFHKSIQCNATINFRYGLNFFERNFRSEVTKNWPKPRKYRKLLYLENESSYKLLRPLI